MAKRCSYPITRSSHKQNKRTSATSLEAQQVAAFLYVIECTWMNGYSATAFPNPTISQFTLKLTSDNSIDPITVRVIHEMGKVIEMRSKLTPGQTIQLGGAYRPGTYFVQIIQGKATRQIKVIKTQY